LLPPLVALALALHTDTIVAENGAVFKHINKQVLTEEGHCNLLLSVHEAFCRSPSMHLK
jgi:hypothetical protein